LKLNINILSNPVIVLLEINSVEIKVLEHRINEQQWLLGIVCGRKKMEGSISINE
jgi:hypothetical protein